MSDTGWKQVESDKTSIWMNLKAHSHQIKIATDWLQTGPRLASDAKIWCEWNHAIPI